MRKFFVIAIPILLLGIFISIMLSGQLLKKPIGKDDDIPLAIQSLIDIIEDDQWQQAPDKVEELHQIWRKIVARVQFSSERDEINAFSMNIARIRGAVRVQDKNSAIIELNEAYEHWKELGN